MSLLVAYLFVFLGGIVGALSRFGVQEACRKWTSMPGWGAILIANVVGSFAIGLAVASLTELESRLLQESTTALGRFIRSQDSQAGLNLLAVGFCGAFTTFSTFSLDNHFLYHENRRALAVNVIASLILSLAAVVAGWFLGQWIAS